MFTDTHTIWGFDYRLLQIPVGIITHYWWVIVGFFFLAKRKNTDVIPGKHFEEFLECQIKAGRYGSRNEIIRARLRLLEEREIMLQALRDNKKHT
ncbi:putative addiction module antidote protein, CC2985 family [Nitrosomonas aestuarii]|uniref:Putative addiction module antidote protein, CC2985 family n=1 Tax=Nitrosomonas aestuarii TaxID=52441 RepID=A0A1I4EVU3_9PROT|nr:type II toxin-antitoxin system ParD family antitoxin [Nitrosomonas aestuarii]SFL09794.1 putative addiction module antidote protein, CC2985 family [Nitrosomonas aestuarii]